MTRENKLALIVGFGLVLFMGILVSDHLSTAQRESSASLQMSAGMKHRSAVTGQGWLVYGVAQDVTTPDRSSETSGLESGSPQIIPIADPGEHSPHHVVGSGDTLQSICKRHYGDSSLDLALAHYNRIPDPDRLALRTRLLLPSAEVLMKTGPHSSAVESSSQPLPTTIQPVEMATYTVQSGDTLSELAQKLLGSARETDRLYELNRDMLRDQNDLRVGIALRYPIAN